ncbi:MAG: hypothetical protein ACJA1A_002119 [Saprospiraceae bacterium]|jgi:hypothetical protein
MALDWNCSNYGLRISSKKTEVQCEFGKNPAVAVTK